MPSLDLRTRTSETVRDVDVPAFFDGELPELAATRSDLAVPGARELGVKPFTLACPAGEWTLAVEGDEVVVRPGDGGDESGRVFLSDDEVGKLVNDLITPMTLVASAAEHIQRGDHGNFLDWWVVLRSLVDDRPAHTAGSIEFRDTSGDPLDLERSFTPDDSDEEMGQFVAEAGCLHLSGWFDPADMEAINREMDAAFEKYTPDDGRSWWAETADGTKRAVRLQKFEQHSPTFAALLGERPVRADRAADRRRLRVAPRRRGTREAARRGEGHLRPDVAQGLRARHALLPLLRAHRRHLGDRRRRDVRAARGLTRIAPGADPARLLPEGVGAARCASCRPRPAT